MRPGDPDTRPFFKVTDAAGVAVTGLVTANFTFLAYQCATTESAPTAWTHGAVVSEAGNGWYMVELAPPAAAGSWIFEVLPVSAAHFLSRSVWGGELEGVDLDGIYSEAILPRAVVGQTSSAQLGTQVQLELVARRYRDVSLVITSDGVTPLPLDTYTNWAIGFRSTDQTTVKQDITTGITGSIAGVLAFSIAEDHALWAALATGVNSISLLWDVVADLGGVSTKTVPIIRSSPCIITRSEYGS